MQQLDKACSVPTWVDGCICLYTTRDDGAQCAAVKHGAKPKHFLSINQQQSWQDTFIKLGAWGTARACSAQQLSTVASQLRTASARNQHIDAILAELLGLC